MFPTSVLEPVERLINRGIDQSGTALEQCRALEGRRMSVRIDPQPRNLLFAIGVTAADGHIYITDNPSDGADVELSGTVMELTRLMFSKHQQPVREGRVRIQGEAEIAEQFRALFILARPDLEEELSVFVGDDLGFQLASAFRTIRECATDALEDIAEQTAEYLHEDGKHFPTRSETEEFFAAVDELANDLARIEARLSRIRKNSRAGHKSS